MNTLFQPPLDIDYLYQLADKDNGLTLISLSMIGFKYDALVKAYGDKYNDYILENIRKTYKFMLDT